MWKHPSTDEIKKLKQEYNDIFKEVQELVNHGDPIWTTSEWEFNL